MNGTRVLESLFGRLTSRYYIALHLQVPPSLHGLRGSCWARTGLNIPTLPSKGLQALYSLSLSIYIYILQASWAAEQARLEGEQPEEKTNSDKMTSCRGMCRPQLQTCVFSHCKEMAVPSLSANQDVCCSSGGMRPSCVCLDLISCYSIAEVYRTRTKP